MSRANEKPRGKILLVGRRKHAEATARRHGWKPVTIDVPPRCEQASNAFGGSADWAIKNSLERFPKSPPVAVAAVATGAVVAAAAVREHFGLPGISREAALRCHDKLVMKKAISAAGIPCAPWMEIGHGYLHRSTYRDAGFTAPFEDADQLRWPRGLDV